MCAENDQFKSNSAIGVLAYTVPAVTELMRQPLEAFDGVRLPSGYNDPDEDNLRFEMKIHNTETNELLIGQNSFYTTLQYGRKVTPELLAVIPQNVVKDSSVTFMVNARNAHQSYVLPGSLPPF